MRECPLIIHVPHSSTYIPAQDRRDIILSDRDLEVELLKMTDWYTDELAHAGSIYGTLIRYEYSRLVVDPERFRDPSNEVMNAVGMGAVYRLTSNKRKLRDLWPEKEENLLRRYYDPYHALFDPKVAEILQKHGKCLIVDIHSYPSKPLPYELHPGGPRPDICIGADTFHTPAALTEFATVFFEKNGLNTAINKPFAGSFVPGRFYQKDNRVSSIMIEIKRSLYMDEGTGAKIASFSNIQKTTDRFIKAVSNFTEPV